VDKQAENLITCVY